MLMASPTALSLLSALLLCLPLAIFFTTTTVQDPAALSAIGLYDNTMKISDVSNAKITNTTQNSIETTVPTTSSPPPPVLSYEDMEDERLLRLASRVSPKTRNPRRVAFMFLTTSSLPLAELWNAFFAKTSQSLYNIYVHGESPDAYFPGVFTNRDIVNSKPAFRQTPTLISAARRMLAHALLHDPCNYMFVLLSPSCIPLHSFNFTYATLTRSNKSFIEILGGEPTSYSRWAARGPDVMLPEVTLEEFRIGSQFWALVRPHALEVVNDTMLWSKFKLPCVVVGDCFPEENYFPTLMSMRDPDGCVPATLTHVDWSRNIAGHPVTYTVPEVGLDLILQLRRDRPRYGDKRSTDGSERVDPFLFARKFAPDTLQPLLSIAKNIIFNDDLGELERKPDSISFQQE